MRIMLPRRYLIRMPASDPRLVDTTDGMALTEEALESALYCGKVRSYNLSGANFVAYDDGVKEGERLLPGQRRRRQMGRQVAAAEGAWATAQWA